MNPRRVISLANESDTFRPPLGDEPFRAAIVYSTRPPPPRKITGLDRRSPGSRGDGTPRRASRLTCQVGNIGVRCRTPMLRIFRYSFEFTGSQTNVHATACARQFCDIVAHRENQNMLVTRQGRGSRGTYCYLYSGVSHAGPPVIFLLLLVNLGSGLAQTFTYSKIDESVAVDNGVTAASDGDHA